MMSHYSGGLFAAKVGSLVFAFSFSLTPAGAENKQETPTEVPDAAEASEAPEAPEESSAVPKEKTSPEDTSDAEIITEAAPTPDDTAPDDTSATVQEEEAAPPEAPVNATAPAEDTTTAEAVAAETAPNAVQDEPTPEAGADDEMDELLDMSLEDILNIDVDVYGATKSATRVSELAANVTVITREQMAEWGYTSVAEALARQMGFYVLDDYVIPNVGMRGVSGGMWGESGMFKVMIDGHSVAFRATGGNWLGPELIPLSAVKHIEIIRGPASSIYGADAFLGVINIVTRDAHEKSWGAEVSAGPNMVDTNVGSGVDTVIMSDWGPVNMLAAYRFDNRDYSGLHLPSTSPDPYLPTYSTDDDTTQSMKQISHSLFLKLAYTDKPVKATVSGYLSMIERGAELSPWLQLGNELDDHGRSNINRVSLANGHVAAHVDIPMTDSSELKLDATYFQGGPRSSDRIEVGGEFYHIRREFGFRGVDSTLEAHWNPFENFNFVLGAAFLYDHEDPQYTVKVLKSATDEQDAGSVIEDAGTDREAHDMFDPAAYTILQWSPLKQFLRLQGSLRFDYHNVYGPYLAGRAGAVSEPVKKLTLRLMYGGAFKSPSSLLLYAQPLRPGEIIGNPDLKAQYIHNGEFMISYMVLDSLRIQTGVALNVVLNKAEFRQEAGNMVARNVSKLRTVTWESAVEGSPVEWLRGYLRLAYTAAYRELDEAGYLAGLVGNENVGYPPWMAGAGLTFVPPIPIRIMVEGRYLSSRRAQESNILLNGDSYELSQTFLLDAGLMTDKLHIFGEQGTYFSLVARNIIGDKTADPGFAGVDYPREPRTLFLYVSQELGPAANK